MKSFHDWSQAIYCPFKKTSFISKKQEKSEKLNKKLALITEDNFPQLIVQPKITKSDENGRENKINLNFIDKLCISKENPLVSDEKKEEEVPPGWVQLTKDKITKKVTIKYGKKTYLSDDEKIINPTMVLINLINLHEQRKYNYIRDWGEESYEKTFKCIDYDYDYFEKLDEEYEINQIYDEYVFDQDLE